MKEDASKKYVSAVKGGGVLWQQTTFMWQPLGAFIIET